MFPVLGVNLLSPNGEVCPQKNEAFTQVMVEQRDGEEYWLIESLESLGGGDVHLFMS